MLFRALVVILAPVLKRRKSEWANSRVLFRALVLERTKYGAKLPLPCYLELERRKAELSYWNGRRMNGLTIQSTLIFIAQVLKRRKVGWTSDTLLLRAPVLERRRDVLATCILLFRALVLERRKAGWATFPRLWQRVLVIFQHRLARGAQFSKFLSPPIFFLFPIQVIHAGFPE